jgi:UDPglucose 6-dehydrogenase
MTMHHPPRIGVIGVGYVGLVTATALAELGHEVTCIDINPERVARLSAGDVPFFEPGLDGAVRAQMPRLHFTTEVAESLGAVDVAFVCVDTPPSASGHADLSRVESVIDSIPDGSDLTLVMKSTVPVGTGARLQHRLRARGQHAIAYASNPEFLREGSALADVRNPDRIVVGSADPSAADRVVALWAPLGGTVLLCDVASAEMIKLASNAFLATKISFINEIANVCEAVGADATLVAQGMGADHRIGSAFLRAGVGFGGSCFGKDVNALKQAAANVGYHFHLLSGVLEVNALQKRRPLWLLQERLGSLQGRRIAVLGLAFKPGTDDLRDAPSLMLIASLVAAGAVVVAHDPVAGPAARKLLPDVVAIVDRLDDAVAGADGVVLVTEWPEYQSLLSAEVVGRARRPLLVDGRNAIDPDDAIAAGWEWVGIGRPSSASPVDREVVSLLDALAAAS